MLIKVRPLSQVLPEIQNQIVSYDSETSGLTLDHRLCLMQFYIPKQDISWVCPIWTDEYRTSSDDHDALEKYFPTLSIIGHNLQFDLSFLRHHFDVAPKEVIMDTYLMARMRQEQDNSLFKLTQKYFPELSHLLNALHFESDNDEYSYSLKNQDQIKYAGTDPYLAYKLYQRFSSDGIYNKIKDINDIERNFLRVSSRWNANGLKVDRTKLDEGIQKSETDLNELYQEFFRLAGRPVKIHSPADLRKLLFEEFEFPVGETTPKGTPSTSEDALSHIDHPIIEALSNLKSVDSIYRSSLKIPEYLDKEDFAHPTVEAIGYDGTSRVYTKDPSINQWNWEIRKAVIPQKGNKFVFFDLSSAEPVILAHWAGCQQLIDVHERGEDLHSYIAAKILKKDSITKEERDVSKIVNLAISYGSEGAAIVRKLHCSPETARQYIDNYNEAFPEITNWIEEKKNYARKTSYTHSYLGRPRRLPDIFSDSFQKQAKAERQVINTAIQGSCADFFKLICIKALKYEPQNIFIRFGVFDSFLLEVPQTLSDTEIRNIIDDIIDVAPWTFRYKWSQGDNWFSASKS